MLRKYNIVKPVTRSVAPTSIDSTTGNPAHDVVGTASLPILAFILAHVLLAFAMRQLPAIGTAHAILVLGLGLLWVMRGDQPERLACLAVYITGAELLWRGTNATIYEFAKYSVSLLLILWLLKQRRHSRAGLRPTLYLVLLLPSIVVLPEFDREKVSFNLSGPLSLAISVMFFSTVRLGRFHMRQALVAGLAPIVGLAAIALRSTLTTGELEFSSNSNFVTSGGIGPNQVSALLGLGALLAILYLLIEPRSASLRLLMAVCAVWLTCQSALTFSRGGLWTALGALAVAVVYLARIRRLRMTFLFGAAATIAVGYFLVLPLLNDFTGGTLLERFTDLDSTGRDHIAQADLQVFADNPLLGVGPGQSRVARYELLLQLESAHIEYTRLLSEHGIFGVLSLVVLLSMVVERFRKPAQPLDKAFVVAFTMWTLLYMLHAAMRLAAPGVMFGLGSATFALDEDAPV